MKDDYLHQEIEEEVKEDIVKPKKPVAKKEKKTAADLNQGTKRTDR
jgi:hypothetical protein